MSKVRIQSILYENSVEQLSRGLESLISAVSAVPSEVKIVLGSNDSRDVNNREYRKLVLKYAKLLDIEFYVLGSNLGHGAAHNNLFFNSQDDSDFLLIINPDGVLGPTSLLTLIRAMNLDTTGAVEARQLPFDHPKVFNLINARTSWATGSCLLVRSEVFRKIGGFDERFFLHCDDIDLSWRVRNEGFNIVQSSESVFFHDKRLASNGYPELSESERIYGPLGALLLAHKYGLKRGLKFMLKDLSQSPDPVHKEVLEMYRWSIEIYPPISIRKEIPKYVNHWKFESTRY